MRYENKFWDRKDDLFLNGSKSFDLSSLKVLHSGVDTVKQLFNCLLKVDVLLKISDKYDSGFSNPITIGGIDWLISKSSKSAGYQWILKNLDEGLIVLLKSFYTDESLNGSHVKIEASPYLISTLTPLQLSQKLKFVASSFANQVIESSVAVHIAVDLKNFVVPEDFEYRLVTKSKRQMRHLGISKMETKIAETSVIYGDRQTYTFGGAGGLQFQLYDKVTEAIKSDKIDYWEKIWKEVPCDESFEPEYQDGDSVHRLEMRFHHSIIQQFCNGTKDDFGEYIVINNFHDLSRHLTALWKYSLNNFRLQHSTTYIDPVWQKLIEDIQIHEPSPCYLYKRAAKLPGQQTRRNTAMWLGNQLKLQCRQSLTVEFAVSHILKSGLEPELMDYFGLFGSEDRPYLGEILTEFVARKFTLLRLNGITK